MLNKIRYSTVSNAQCTYDICAFDEEGRLADRMQDVSCNQEAVEDIVRLYNERLPLACFHEITERLIGTLI